MQGDVQLDFLKQPPTYLKELLSYTGGRKSAKFREQIRAYNSIFAFTSMGAKTDETINSRAGPYVFKISGQNYHRIGGLIPARGSQPKFAQLYVHDTENEVHNRLHSLKGGNQTLDTATVQNLKEMLDEHNKIAKLFRMARDRLSAPDAKEVHIRLIGTRSNESRQYTMPTTTEIAGLIVGDLGQSNGRRDIVIEHKSEGLQRIKEFHPKFMAMQYPLLFPYGEDGFHLHMFYSQNNRRKTKRKYVTMREYYAYRIQQRKSEANTLICGGRLFQQYIVDAYTAIEEQRMRYYRMNQTVLRTDLYRNVCDAVVRGDTIAAATGKRIVLPSSFTGGPRYMVQNYQDAMAICRTFGNPDIFLTFTANPKWPEVKYMLHEIPGQPDEDRPDIKTRVFKMKLDQLMKHIVEGQYFGQVLSGKSISYNLFTIFFTLTIF
jgi:uncharacterized protein YdcH (DUF465 family)